MALVKLTKVAQKPEQGAFITTELDGVTTHTRIPLSDYANLGQALADSLGITGTYVGGFTQYEYETPTGLLREGEYGDDGIDPDGNPLYQVKVDGGWAVVGKEKVVADKIETTDPVLVERIVKSKKIP